MSRCDSTKISLIKDESGENISWRCGRFMLCNKVLFPMSVDRCWDSRCRGRVYPNMFNKQEEKRDE